MKQIIFQKYDDDKILEVHNNMFKDDKIVISIQKNENKKQVAKANFFLEVEDFYYLAKQVHNGSFYTNLEAYIKAMGEHKRKEREYTSEEMSALNPLEIQVGNYLPKEKKYISRIIRIKPTIAENYVCFFEIIESDAEKQENGEITPVRNNINRVCFHLTEKNLVKMVLMIESHLQAFKAAKYGFMEKEFFYSKEDLAAEKKRTK